MKVPLVKINREKFLRKELIKYFPEDIVNLSIEKNPAFAGVERERVNKIATHIINFESNKVTAISAAAGIPGGAAMAATIPADLRNTSVSTKGLLLVRLCFNILYILFHSCFFHDLGLSCNYTGNSRNSGADFTK